MSCPRPDHLGAWVDGALEDEERAAVELHVEGCGACRVRAEAQRALGGRIASISEPGADCLSVDAMASAIESRIVPSHVKLCPRCAGEYRALRAPAATERRATRRMNKPAAPGWAWAAAAVVLVAAGSLMLVPGRPAPAPDDLAIRPAPAPRVELPPRPPAPPPPATPDPRPAPELELPPRAPAPAVPPVDPPKNPVAAPEPDPSPEPAPKAEPSTDPAPRPSTESRAFVAVAIRSGAVASLTGGKWVKASRIEEGMALRSDGRTQIDFANARITLDGASRFTLGSKDLLLSEGGLSAEVAAGSPFELVLGEARFVPQTSIARVLLGAKSDRLVVEEGVVKWKDLVLPEGIEHRVGKDKVEAQKRRSLPGVARPQETVVWRMDLASQGPSRPKIFQGRIEALPEGRMLASTPLSEGSGFYGQATYSSAEGTVIVAKPTLALRFRYFLTEAGPFELVMWNGTKGENFNKPLDGQVRRWTTLTLPLRDVPPNVGGKKVGWDSGDRITSVGWFAGAPGKPSEVYVDLLEFLDLP